MATRNPVIVGFCVLFGLVMIIGAALSAEHDPLPYLFGSMVIPLPWVIDALDRRFGAGRRDGGSKGGGSDTGSFLFGDSGGDGGDGGGGGDGGC